MTPPGSSIANTRTSCPSPFDGIYSISVPVREPYYTTWYSHGETTQAYTGSSQCTAAEENGDVTEDKWC